MTGHARGRGHRILVVDDDTNVLDAYRRVFATSASMTTQADELAAELFGEDGAPSSPARHESAWEVLFCRQGSEAVSLVDQARIDGAPFALAFLDMRMPPGMDGLETARRLRQLDHRLNIVIVTGYSDHQAGEISRSIGAPDKLFYLTKPFDRGEILQLAAALTQRWTLDEANERELAAHLRDLERLNAELLRSEAHARRLARHDILTGLANRGYLFDRLSAHCDGDKTEHQALIYLDLDRFKEVNDTLGHAAGDDLLRDLAERIRTVLGERGFAARLGGDEFAVAVASSAAPDIALAILDACARPFSCAGHAIDVRMSAGVAQDRDESGEAIDAVEWMRRADVALYAAKGAGRGRICEFDPDLDRAALTGNLMATELRRAIDMDELSLLYQPIMGSAGRLEGVEALLRWTSEALGIVSPAVFVAVAERSHLIRDLGWWVVRRAFRDAKAWPQLVTSINLSPAQLRYPAFASEVVELAASEGVACASIEFEVTENMLIEDLEQASQQIALLKEAGFRIALDDFGTGYSSLNYLTRIPFDKLKIDRSFVQNLTRSSEAAALLQSIVGLARALGLSITAEGVEEEDQEAFLVALGCNHIQGYLYSGPVTRDEILGFDSAPRALAAAV
jgi:diguanylate cyclase (GGDEF)-like protein